MFYLRVNVSNITVTCSVLSYALGGSISGLTGTVRLRNYINLKTVNISSNGSWQFVDEVNYGEDYDLRVLLQPDGQTCTLTNDLGTLTGAVSNVNITCVTD